MSGYFGPIIVSGDWLPQAGPAAVRSRIERHETGPAEVLFVGNDLYRDIHGPQKLSIKTVFFKSGEVTEDRARDARLHHLPFSQLLDAVRFLSVLIGGDPLTFAGIRLEALA
ncbi:MAG: hypothetical protein IPK39_24070 [Sulfuritalea sp.]|nr:hypothetical protein [Sulfuritalea sp.]